MKTLLFERAIGRQGGGSAAVAGRVFLDMLDIYGYPADRQGNDCAKRLEGHRLSRAPFGIQAQQGQYVAVDVDEPDHPGWGPRQRCNMSASHNR